MVVAVDEVARPQAAQDAVKCAKPDVGPVPAVMDPVRGRVRHDDVDAAGPPDRGTEAQHAPPHLTLRELHALPVVPHAPLEPGDPEPGDPNEAAVDILAGQPAVAVAPVVIAAHVKQ